MTGTLIGLIGRQRAGKNLTAEILRQLYPDREIAQFAFADKMREALYRLNPHVNGDGLQYLVDTWGWDVVKEHYPEVRALLQRFGTEVGRKLFGEDFWVDQIWPDVLDALSRGAVAIITDARFNNELFRIAFGGHGMVWRIERLDLEPEDMSLPKFQHASEKEWREWAVVHEKVFNDSRHPGTFAMSIVHAAVNSIGPGGLLGIPWFNLPVTLDRGIYVSVERAALAAQSPVTPQAA